LLQKLIDIEFLTVVRHKYDYSRVIYAPEEAYIYILKDSSQQMSLL